MNNLPKGAQANKKRKENRIKLAQNYLRTQAKKVNFKSKTALFEFIAEYINNEEQKSNDLSNKGPCTRTGLYGVKEIKKAVNDFWLGSSELSINSDSFNAVLENGNLKAEVAELDIALRNSKETIKRLESYIKNHEVNTGFEDSNNFPAISQSLPNNDVVNKLVKVIYLLENWGEMLFQRSDSGGFYDLAEDVEIVSNACLEPYISRVPLDTVLGE